MRVTGVWSRVEDCARWTPTVPAETGHFNRRFRHPTRSTDGQLSPALALYSYHHHPVHRYPHIMAVVEDVEEEQTTSRVSSRYPYIPLKLTTTVVPDRHRG